MSMFSVLPSIDRSLEEGTVIQVDPIRFICKVRTLRGKLLNEVQWLLPSGGSSRGADRLTPLMGDRVVISTGLGYPVILGFLPRLQSADGAAPLNISTSQVISDTGAFGPGSRVIGDQNKPKDIVAGDRIISSIGAAMIGLLRAGSVLIRANRGAEILMSNFLSLVRVVSRKWVHITDAFTDVSNNYKGRLYRYTGYSKDFEKAKNEDYNLHVFHGDVAAASVVKTSMQGDLGDPAADEVILKEQITDEADGTLTIMYRSIKTNGEHEVKVIAPDHVTKTTQTVDDVRISWKTDDAENYILINGDIIQVHHKDGADITLSSSSIVLNKGSSTTTLTDSYTTIASSGHQIAITSSGIAVS